MNTQEFELEKSVFDKLSRQAPHGYRLNELKRFSYPVRKIRLEVLLNKDPDQSLVSVYRVLLKAIAAGLDTKETLFSFLGLSFHDEFMERELFYLREKEFLDLVSNRWRVTELGQQFVDGQPILRSEEREEFEFLVDGLTGNLISAATNRTDRDPVGKEIKSALPGDRKDHRILIDKEDALADLVKSHHQGRAYLISYDPKAIVSAYDNWIHCWFIEYIPVGDTSQEARLEVKTVQGFKKVEFMTQAFNEDYRHWLMEITDGEREVIEQILELPEVAEVPAPAPKESGIQGLGLWETKNKFIEALQTVKNRILIESPWIRQATLDYIPFFEKILLEGKELWILYGIGEQDEYHEPTLEKLKNLQYKFSKTFRLIHLPTHLRKVKPQLTGTHRKLVIKDEDYYISGSFNFLSFGKQEHQKVANEESTLITQDVKLKWDKVLADYGLSI